MILVYPHLIGCMHARDSQSRIVCMQHCSVEIFISFCHGKLYIKKKVDEVEKGVYCQSKHAMKAPTFRLIKVVYLHSRGSQMVS